MVEKGESHKRCTSHVSIHNLTNKYNRYISPCSLYELETQPMIYNLGF